MAYTNENRDKILREAENIRDFMTADIVNFFRGKEVTADRVTDLKKQLEKAIYKLKDLDKWVRE